MLKSALYFCLFMLTLLGRTVVVSATRSVQTASSALPTTQGSDPVLDAAADGLVRDILTRAGGRTTFSVSFHNFAQWAGEAEQAAESAILESLRRAGAQLVRPETAAAEVEVNFSEDWQGYVWVAVIHQGPSQQVAIKKLPRQAQTSAAPTPRLTVRQKLVWSQDVPLLDFFADGQNLVLLEPGQIVLYSSDAGQWRERATLSINHKQAWPRDVQGRLQVNGLQVSAFLPGTLCSGLLSPPSLDCHPGDDPWPIDPGHLMAFFSGRRNFFNGVLSGSDSGISVPAFFSAAVWSSANQRQWIFTGTDGRARFYQNDLANPAAVFDTWGSALAAVHSGCNTGWQLLVSSASDSVLPDRLQAVEITGREAQTVSEPVGLSGPISAMWTAGNNSDAVNAVLESSSTGQYEAFTLSVSCS